MYTDKTLVCRDCGKEFVFTAGEQEFYAEKGFEHEPVRCRECRSARKARLGTAEKGGSRQMYTAVCAECGAECEVPFEPTNGRPVYCRECFSLRRARA